MTQEDEEREEEGRTLTVKPTTPTKLSLPISPQATKRAVSPPLRAERGVKLFHRELMCHVIGSRSIDWLLSLSSHDWAAIYVAPECMESAIGTCVGQRLKEILRLHAPLPHEHLDVILMARSDTELAQHLQG